VPKINMRIGSQEFSDTADS